MTVPSAPADRMFAGQPWTPCCGLLPVVTALSAADLSARLSHEHNQHVVTCGTGQPAPVQGRRMWLGASLALGHPVYLDETYPHVCGSTFVGTMSGQPVTLWRRDCAACEAGAPGQPARRGKKAP